MPRLAVISAHTSPLERPSTGDAGGMNVYLASVLPALAALGWKVTVITAGTEGGRLGRGVTVRPVAVAASDKYSLAIEADAFAAAAEGADVVHSHYWVSGLAGMLTGLPHVHTMHSSALGKNARLAEGDVPEPEERIAAERRILSIADAVVVAGVSERDALRSDYDVPKGRIATVPPGVEERFHPQRTAAPAGRRRSIALVGRLQPLKGQRTAIEAMALLAPEERPLLRLVGGAGPGRDDYVRALRDSVVRLGLEGDVVFDGALARDDVARALREARLALVPSAAETFGLVALEAAASGTPVIAHRTVGLVDAVRDGRTGILVDDLDPEHWAEAIRALLVDDGLHARLARGGDAWAGEHSWTRTARGLDAVYRRVLSDRDGRRARR